MSKAAARREVANMSEKEVQRIIAQLDEALERGRRLFPSFPRRTTDGLEPTKVLLPKQAEKIARGQW